MWSWCAAQTEVKPSAHRTGSMTIPLITRSGTGLARFRSRLTAESMQSGSTHVTPRPGISAVRAVRIEELRVGIVRGVTCVEPDCIDSAVRRDRKRAKPVPLRVINGIVIDPVRCAEGLTSVCAAHQLHIAATREAGGLNAREHVNIVVRTRARTVRRQENLTD